MSSMPQSPDSTAPDRNPLAAEAYEALKAAISSGELQPRECLYETVISRRLKADRDPVGRVRQIGLRGPGQMKDATCEHRTLVGAIGSRDPEAARRATHDCLVPV